MAQKVLPLMKSPSESSKNSRDATPLKGQESPASASFYKSRVIRSADDLQALVNHLEEAVPTTNGFSNAPRIDFTAPKVSPMTPTSQVAASPLLISPFAGFAPDIAFSVTPSGSVMNSAAATPMRRGNSSGRSSGLASGLNSGFGTPARQYSSGNSRSGSLSLTPSNSSRLLIPSSLPGSLTASTPSMPGSLAASRTLGKLPVIHSAGDLQLFLEQNQDDVEDAWKSETAEDWKFTHQDPALDDQDLEAPGIDIMNLIYSACILVAFIAVRSALTILLQQCNTGNGYPFVLQTVMIGPFFMQMICYVVQTCKELGFANGMQVLSSSWRHMGPAVLFSVLVSVSMMLQTLSLNFIDASTFIVLLQLVLVFVAVGEKVILKQSSTAAIWILIVMQAACVSYYEVSAVEGSSSGGSGQAGGGKDMSRQLLGMSLVLGACVCSALGTILQQRFLQSAGGTVVLLPSVKLFYQHVIGFVLMVVVLVSNPTSMEAIMTNGFFHGWSSTTVLTAVVMWLSFFAASSVTAYVSAMAGAMGSAVVVIVVGVCGSIVKGQPMAPAQIAVICAIAFITTSYTYLKFKMMAANQEPEPQNGLHEPLLAGKD